MGRRRKYLRHLPQGMQLKHGAYYFLARQDGRQKWMRLSRDYCEALRRYADLVGRAHDASQTVADAVAHYIAVKDLKPDTLAGYEQSSHRLCRVFGKMALDDVRRDHIYRYLVEHGTVAANRDRALLSAVFTHFQNAGLFQGANPCRGLQFRNPEVPRKRYLTDAEFKQLVDALPHKLSLMARWAYATGMRQSDVLALKLTDASDAGVGYVPGKARKNRPADPILIEWSTELREIWRLAAGARIGSQALFPTSHGGHYSRDSFQSIWQRWRKKIPIKDLRWHDIRRKTGSDSSTTEEAMERLAHADSGITKRHYRAKPRVIKPLV